MLISFAFKIYIIFYYYKLYFLMFALIATLHLYI